MLDVVVGYTRKTEVRLWRYLFQYAGRPKDLFEQCMERGMLKSAGGYLLVLHTLEHLKDSSQVRFLCLNPWLMPLQDTVRLLLKAINAGDWDLCKELARFLTSFDSYTLSLTTIDFRYRKYVTASLDACRLTNSVFDASSNKPSNFRVYACGTTKSGIHLNAL